MSVDIKTPAITPAFTPEHSSLVSRRVNALTQLKMHGLLQGGTTVMPNGPHSVYKQDEKTGFIQKTDVTAQIEAVINQTKPDVNTIVKRIQGMFDLYEAIMSSPHISRIPKPAVQDMLTICIECCTKSKYNVMLNVGYGGSDDGVLLRTPSYVVPAVEILQIFKRFYEQGVVQTMPKLRIFQATTLATMVNTNLQVDAVVPLGRQRRDAVADFLDQALEDTDADVRPYIVYENDESIVLPTADEAEQMFATAQLDEDHTTFFEKRMMASAGKRIVGSEAEQRRGAQQYIAAHTRVFMDAFTPGKHGITHQPNATISFGSQRGELPFNHFRHSLQQSSTDAHKPLAVRFGQKPGDHPPYYQGRDKQGIPYEQDPLLSDVTEPPTILGKVPSVTKRIVHDLKVQWTFLVTQCGGNEEVAMQKYRAFCRSFT